MLVNFPRIHIPGEEESETISQEVNRVIKYRVEGLAREKVLSDFAYAAETCILPFHRSAQPVRKDERGKSWSRARASFWMMEVATRKEDVEL